MGTAREGGSEFWRFSLALYGRDGIPSACVALQDAHGLDVNLMLFALWLASNGRLVTSADLAAADAAVGDWRREAVIPLRGVRRFLKEAPAALDEAGVAALRARVKAVELESERLQQEALFALRSLDGWGVPAAPRDAGPANMQACAQAVGASFAAQPWDVILGGYQALIAATP